MRILIVEDEQDIATSLQASLEAECFAVDVAFDGEQGSFLGRINKYDVIILDNILPKKNGNIVCREIRQVDKTVQIIMLSVLTETETKVELFNTGADDYLTKPFLFSELLARIRALLRRRSPIADTVLQVDNIVLDQLRHIVKRDAQEIRLTKKEFMLLEYLMCNPGIALSRSMIMEHVWDMNADPFSNTIEVHIRSLRNKLEAQRSRKIIHTVPGHGYKIEAPVMPYVSGGTAVRMTEMEKMKQLYRFAELGRLSSGLFHDLTNHLSAFSLNVERSQLQQAVHISEKIKQFVSTIRKQIVGTHVVGMFSLQEEINEAVQLFQYKARLSDVAFECIVPIEPVYLTGDRTKCNQVVANLLANAIDAYANHMRPDARRVQVRLAKSAVAVHMSVTDWGSGIPSIIREKIFEPFFTTKDLSHGIGLGLSLTKHIVENDFGGTIDVESEEGRFSTFHVQIPFNSEIRRK